MASASSVCLGYREERCGHLHGFPARRLPGESAYRAGVAQQSASASSLLTLRLRSLNGDPSRQLLVMDTTKDFDTVEIEKGAVLGALLRLNVPSRCVAPAVP